MRTHIVLSRAAPLAVCLAAALGVWLLFFPAIMSSDSLDQYRQALSWEFNDAHPPVMAIVLGLVLRSGGDIWTVMLVQSVVGLLGVRALVHAWLEAFTDGLMSETTRAWIATGIALLLLVPLTPLAFYLMTFWKDAWLAILFVWIGALALRLFDEPRRNADWRFVLRFGLLAVLMALAVLVRHNALVVLPAFWLIGWMILRRRRVRLAWLIAGLPVVLAPLGDRLIGTAFDVRRAHPVNLIMAQDLVGLCVLDPALRAELSYTDCHIADDRYQARYRFW
ncbi:MAG: hypothetical protein KAY37_12915 [Phycisphaerae bacterium]|nr:hypothetical protein [Phycisphaerae bacterium]